MAQSRAGCRTTVDARFLIFFVVLAARVGACAGEIGHHAPVGAAGTGAASGTAGASGTGANSGGGTVLPPPGTDPGRVTLHRLNRVEYNNTVRDLLGTTATPADEFPIDDRGSGFDNIADVLTLSPLHLELYPARPRRWSRRRSPGAQRAQDRDVRPRGHGRDVRAHPSCAPSRAGLAPPGHRCRGRQA